MLFTLHNYTFSRASIGITECMLCYAREIFIYMYSAMLFVLIKTTIMLKENY